MVDVDKYRRDGWLVVPGVCSLSLQPYQDDPVRDYLDFAYGEGLERFRAAARAFARSHSILDMFLRGRIKHVVERLGIGVAMFQTDIVCHAMGYDLAFDGTHAHQDYPALQSSLNAVVVWIPMHDVGVDNYPVEVVSGSHLNGLYPCRETQHYSEIEPAGMEFTPVEVPAGGALFMSVFTVHRTRFPGTGRRVAFSWRYEDMVDPFFTANGRPSAQRRVIDRELKFVPTPEQVRGVFR